MNTIFLKFVVIVVTMILLNASCKKSVGSQPPPVYIKLKVLELETNTPVPYASVEIYDCTRRGWGGCTQSSLVGKQVTDPLGSFQYDSEVNPYFIVAHHDNYWDGATGGEEFPSGGQLPIGDIHLTPIAYSRIHLKRVNPHSPYLSLVILIGGVFGSRGAYNLPLDSTVILSSFGNSNNRFSWYFANQAGDVDTTDKGGSFDYYIHRFDTASVQINY